jgi:two-component system, NtrC family, sensor kinase
MQDQTTRESSAGAPLRPPSVLRELLRGPMQRLVTLFSLTLLVALGLLVAVAWSGIQRLEPLGQHLEQQARLLAVDRAIKKLLADQDNQDNAIAPATLAAIRQQLAQATAAGDYSDAAAPDRLRALDRTLANPRVSAAELAAARSQIEQVLDTERTARQTALLTFKSDAKAELALAVCALLVLPTTALLVLLLLGEHIRQPLRDLNNLLALIGEGRRRPAPLGKVGVPLRPIMEGYNRLVEQLAAAVTENQQYQQRLEGMVQEAAGALIRQQHELAEADRLAAVGEISARVAHELKNPLAGIEMALVNLKEDCKEPDQCARLDLVRDEVARVARLLDQLLLRPKRLPEPCQDIAIRPLVADLLALLRYQIPARVALENSVGEQIHCRLEHDRLRQVLLNLVLNSAQAIGDACGTITVTASATDHALRLSVADDGPGFPCDILEHGVRPFFTTRIGGTGLGLPTVQRLARRMHGRLELANRKPKGAIATLIIGRECSP